MKQFIFFTVALLLAACNTPKADPTIALLRQLGITEVDSVPMPARVEPGNNPLNNDSIVPEPGYLLDDEHRSILASQINLELTDSTQLIGVRPVGDKYALAAYMIPLGGNPNRFKVYFVTHASDGTAIDAIDLGEFHTCEHQQPLRFGGNKFYTTDAAVAFEGERRIVQHRLMTLTSLYLKDHSLTELWRVDWVNEYLIDDDGRIHFDQQYEHSRTADLDDPIIEQYQDRDVPPGVD